MINLLQLLKSIATPEELWQGNFGLEREMLRVDSKGNLASTPHPAIFGSKLNHPFITTDFAENQVELITPVCQSQQEAHQYISSLYDIVASEINDELLWPQSMPANIQAPEAIVPAQYEEEQGKHHGEYRQYLLKKYGAHRQVISGLHYNFSFKEELLERLYDEMGEHQSFKAFKNEIYLKIVRNYMRYHWLIIYLMGYSPAHHQTYDCGDSNEKLTQPIQPVSIRNSVCGYENKEALTPEYYKLDNYCKDLESYIQSNTIKDAKEYYSSIRLKPQDPTNVLASLREDGISYVEIRSLDLNPFEKTGISVDDLKFLHVFLLLTLLEEEQVPYLAKEALHNKAMVSMYGLNDNIMLMCNEKPRSLIDWGLELLTKMSVINETLELNSSDILEHKKQLLLTQNPPAKQVKALMQTSDFLTAHLALANKYKAESLAKTYQLAGYEDLELSTQILLRECLKRGVHFELIDRQDNFVKLTKGNQIEYVKQATKTSLDNYVTVLAMENKVVTKRILEDHHIVVPSGAIFSDIKACKKAAGRFIKEPIVIKPKSTNFGLGITIFNQPTTVEAFEKAVDIAFKHDDTILIERFIKGREYRILVIDDEVVGVLHRVPANVVGDGVSSIAELVALKNQHPWRGKGYKRPLEQIEIDESAQLFLQAQGLTSESVLKQDDIVYLRENSNISTGGDSLDFTDDLHESYKATAIQAAKAIGARICGVDMMIETLEEEGDYGIIELNFNPAIHIHTFPYQGISREPAAHILKALGFISSI